MCRDGLATRMDWPMHYWLEHVANDMETFFQETGWPFGRGTCQTQEHLNRVTKTALDHNSNGHLSSTNIDDNQFAQMQKQKLAQFFHGWKNPEEMKKPRNLKVCEACLKHGYMHLNGEQILHYVNNACACMRMRNCRLF